MFDTSVKALLFAFETGQTTETGENRNARAKLFIKYPGSHILFAKAEINKGSVDVASAQMRAFTLAGNRKRLSAPLGVFSLSK